MVIVDQPYVSPILAKTLTSLNVPVVQLNHVDIPARDDKLLHLIQSDSIQYQKMDWVFVNAESAYSICHQCNLPSETKKMIDLFKDKIKFRHFLKAVYPDFYFTEKRFEELEFIQTSMLPYPIILKPSIGYGSVGVFRIENEREWKQAIQKIKWDAEMTKKKYHENVINEQKWIIEEWIDGEEYAIDGYYNDGGQAVILNVFKRMFANDNDTSDRIYYTSRFVIKEGLEDSSQFLNLINKDKRLRHFPLHLEIRKSTDGRWIPIEVNPLRFAGIGTTDLGFFAYHMNSYRYFIEQKQPSWQQIMQSMDDSIYSFYCAELPVSMHVEKSEEIDHERFKQQFEDIIEYRDFTGIDPITFAVVFYKSKSIEENKRLLQLRLEDFICKPENIVYK